MARLLGAVPGSSLVGILLYKPESGELAPLIYVPQSGRDKRSELYHFQLNGSQ